MGCCDQTAGSSLRTSLLSLLGTVVGALKQRPNDLNDVHDLLYKRGEEVKKAKRVPLLCFRTLISMLPPSLFLLPYLLPLLLLPLLPLVLLLLPLPLLLLPLLLLLLPLLLGF